MLKKTLLGAVAAGVIALAPFAAPLATHATTRSAIHPNAIGDIVTLGGHNYKVGQNGGCQGPLVGVYGSSALKNFIPVAATNFCNAQSNKMTAPDVEYTIDSGGDSCPGLDYAADNSDGNEIGVSDVFSASCTGSQARPASKVTDNKVAVNVVIAIAQCAGASVVQGGAVEPANGSTFTANPCQGNGDGNNDRTFVYPNDLSVGQAQALFSLTVQDLGQIGGTTGSPPVVQNRVVGSGTRITYCDNVFGTGNDASCANNSFNLAPGSGDEETDVCGGNPFPSPPVSQPSQDVNSIGYNSRAGILVDARKSAPALTPVSGCGIVSLNNHTGWNATCNPLNPTTLDGPSASGDGVTECNGDNEVISGAYTPWGYEHFFLNAGSTNNAAAKQFISFLTANANVNPAPTGSEQAALQQQGFMRLCQMQFTRGIDAGPFSSASSTTC